MYTLEQVTRLFDAWPVQEPSTTNEENPSSVRHVVNSVITEQKENNEFERDDPMAWPNLVNFILPEIANNQNIQNKIRQNIRNEYTIFDFKTLFWTIMEERLVVASGVKMRELSNYMRFKSPAMFVNSPLNLLPKFMTILMKVCNWQVVADDFFYVFFERNHSYIKCSRGELFVGIPVGIQNALDMEKQVTPFIEMLVLARVNAIFAKQETHKDLQLPEEIWYRMTEIRDVGQSFEFFKPCVLDSLMESRQNEHCKEVGFPRSVDADASPGLAKLFYLRPVPDDIHNEVMPRVDLMLYYRRVLPTSDVELGIQSSEFVMRFGTFQYLIDGDRR